MWGPNGIDQPIRKNGGGAILGALTGSGPDVGVADLSFPLHVSWTDAAPPGPTSGNTGVHAYAGGQNAKLVLEVAAATTPRTLHLYIGAYSGLCRLDVSLTDGSAGPATVSLPGPTASFATGRYSVVFAAKSSSAKLHVEYTATTSTTYVDLLAATVE